IGPPYRGGRTSINTKIESLVAPSRVDIPLRRPPDRLGGGTRLPSEFPHRLAVIGRRRHVQQPHTGRVQRQVTPQQSINETDGVAYRLQRRQRDTQPWWSGAACSGR